jgi:hypothetical protein
MVSRKDELKEALGMQEEEPEEQEAGSVLRRGRVLGQGRLKTRINWGFWVLIAGVILFLVWVLTK